MRKLAMLIAILMAVVVLSGCVEHKNPPCPTGQRRYITHYEEHVVNKEPKWEPVYICDDVHSIYQKRGTWQD